MAIHGLGNRETSFIQRFSPAILGVAAVAALGYYSPIPTAMVGLGAFCTAAALHQWAANREFQTINLAEEAAGLRDLISETTAQREETLKAMDPAQRESVNKLLKLADLEKAALTAMKPESRKLFTHQLTRIAQGLPLNAKERVILSDLLRRVPEAKREGLANYFENIGFPPEQKVEAFRILDKEIPDDIKKDEVVQAMANLPDYLKLVSLKKLSGMLSQAGWQASFRTWSINFRQISDQLVNSWMTPSQKQEIVTTLLEMPEEQRETFLTAVNAICPQGDGLRFQAIHAIAQSGREISKIAADVQLLATTVGLKNPDVQNKLDLIDILTGIKANGRLNNNKVAPFEDSPIGDKIKLLKIFAHMPSAHKNAAISIFANNSKTESKETILKIVKDIPEKQLYITYIANEHLITFSTKSAERAKFLELLQTKSNSKESAILLSKAVKGLIGNVQDQDHRLNILDLIIKSKNDIDSTVKLIKDATELTKQIDSSFKADIIKQFISIPELEKGPFFIESANKLMSSLKKRERAPVLKSLLDIPTLALRNLFFRRVEKHIGENGTRDILNISNKELEQIKFLEKFIKPEMSSALRSEIIAQFDAILASEDPKDVLTQTLRLEEVPDALKHKYFNIIAKIAQDQRAAFISSIKKINSLISRTDQEGLPQHLSNMHPNTRETVGNRRRNLP